MKITVRSIVCGALLFVIGLTALLGLLAPLIAIGAGNAMACWEHGFDLFSMKSPYFFESYTDSSVVSLIDAIGAMSILQCVCGAAILLLGAAGVCFPKIRRFAVWFALSAAALAIVYMALGIVYKEKYLDLIGYTGPFDRTAWIRTYGYIPLIFIAAELLALFICNRFVPERVLFVWTVGQSAEQSDAYRSELERISLLEEYRRLYESGALSEEEFLAQKERVLHE